MVICYIGTPELQDSQARNVTSKLGPVTLYVNVT